VSNKNQREESSVIFCKECGFLLYLEPKRYKEFTEKKYWKSCGLHPLWDVTKQEEEC